MSSIETSELTKDFRVFQRRKGVRGAFVDLFRRDYQTLRAVDGVSFRIAPGERVGYIGPNGAGKSTTLKMLTGILVPTSGTVTVGGLDPHRERSRCLRRIGAVFGQRSQLWWDLAPIESLTLLASVYGVSGDAFRARVGEFEKVLEIGPLLRTPVRKLSLGQKMRCELAAALLHSPQVAFLDEPTIGLDLIAKEAIRRFLIEENRQRGTTLILTTHDLSDIEEICTRVIIIDHGRILYDGGLAQLKQRVGGGSSLVFQLLHPAAARASGEAGGDPDQASPLLDALRRRTGEADVSWSIEQEGAVRATFDAARVSRAEVIRSVLERVEVADIAFVDARIDDVIRRIYAGALGKAAR